jgi:coenzyme F420 hydrogenase subunit beta
MTSPTVARVLRGELCTGCGLCAAVSGGAIEMRSTPPGYNRPAAVAEVSAAAERAIAHACPGAVVAPWPDEGHVHPYWGPLRRVLTGFAADDRVRFEASSGGAISAIVNHALASGLIDRVMHVAADPAAPTRNAIVLSRSSQEVLAGSGSRYTASSPLAQIETALADGGRIGFVGKPCDASALRRLAQIDPRVAEHVPLVVSFFCGGVPSHDGVERILADMGVTPGEVREFRYRGRGWPGSAAAATADRGVFEMSYARSWGDFLSKETQFRCKICPDAVGGVADVACADAWYGDEEGYPSFDEQEGRSLIITRTEAGDRLVSAALAAGVLAAEPLDPDEIIKMQPAQARRKRLVLARTAALPLLLQPRPRSAGLRVLEAARRSSVRESLKNFLGTARRTLSQRRSRL